MRPDDRRARFVSLSLLALLAPWASASPLNDTGQIICFDDSATATGTVSVATPAPESTGYAGQDCSRGAAAADAVGAQGKIGTSSVSGRDYSKIGNNGSELADSATRGSGPTDWGCTRDNVTGLIWELRPNDNSFRDQDYRFSWASETNNEGDTCGGTLSPCNTNNYVAAVNSAAVCGFSDWRLPTPMELENLLAYADPEATKNQIDRSLFPDQTHPGGQFLFWSSRALVEDATSAWAMDFDFGWTSMSSKEIPNFVRLVRGTDASAVGGRFSVLEPVSGQFVTRDSVTGLEWKTCAQGLSGANCGTGSVSTLSWSAALSAAASENFAGHSDWRVPTIVELSSLRDFGTANPAINGTAFPGVSTETYWSSTNSPRPTSLNTALNYQFTSNAATAESFKNQVAAVRLVRSGNFLAAHVANADTTPDAFSFAAVNSAPSTLVESATITIAGLTGPASVKVSGAAQSAYSINGGSFASLAGAVRNGDTVKLRHLSAASGGDNATTTLNIGGTTADFISTSVGAPGAPTAVSATLNSNSATISFTAPAADGGQSITGYTATSTPGALTGTCSASPCVVSGLSNGTSYTFTVTASNGVQTGPASAASNAVTPQGAQAIVFGSAPSVVVGGTGSLSATGGGSGNPVVFSSLSTGVCTVSGSNGATVTGVAEGTCSIAANQAGNAAYTAAPQVSLDFAVTKTAQTISFGAAPTLTVGANAALSASGGASGNPVVFSSLSTGICTVSGSNGATVTGVAEGTCSIAANQAGNAAYAAAPQVSQNFAVAKNAQTISFGAAPTLNVGANATLTASGGASGNPVVFSSLSTGICTVSGSNGATVTGVAEGTCSIAANQDGNAAFTSAPQVSLDFSVSKIGQTITFATAPSLQVASSASLSASGGSSGNPITFSSLTPALCGVSGSTVTGLAGGTCTVAADQAGNATYQAAPQATQNINVTKLAQAINFLALTDRLLSSTPLQVSASGGPSANPVTFSTTTAAVCSSGGTHGSSINLIAVGICTVRASQAGDSGHEAATAVDRSFEVYDGRPTIAFVGTPRAVFKQNHNRLFEWYSVGDHQIRVQDRDAPPSQFLQISVSTDNAALGTAYEVAATSVAQGSAPRTAEFILLPMPEQSGQATLTYTVTDSSGLSASVSVLVTVEPVNRRPTAKYITDLQFPDLSPGTYTVAGFVKSSSPGPASEAGQTVTHHTGPSSYPDAFPRVTQHRVDAAGQLVFTLGSSDPLGSSHSRFAVWPRDDGSGDTSQCGSFFYQFLVMVIETPCGEPTDISLNTGLVSAANVTVQRVSVPASKRSHSASKSTVPIAYRIKASNSGSLAATGVRVAASIPPQLSAVSWTCTVPAGACNPASGTGAVNTLVDLGVGESAQIDLNASLANTASFVTLPVSATLPNNAPGDIKVNANRHFVDAVSNGAIHTAGFEN